MSGVDVIKTQHPKSLFVITSKGRLHQLFLPVRVRCIEAQDRIPCGAYVYVEAAFTNPQHRLIYWITGRLYPYYYFCIEITF